MRRSRRARRTSSGPVRPCADSFPGLDETSCETKDQLQRQNSSRSSLVAAVRRDGRVVIKDRQAARYGGAVLLRCTARLLKLLGSRGGPRVDVAPDVDD